MLNYDLTLDEILDLYKKVATEEELAELREELENPPEGENVIARLRDSAQWHVDQGHKRYERILRALEG